jgi:hypothetical protein
MNAKINIIEKTVLGIPIVLRSWRSSLKDKRSLKANGEVDKYKVHLVAKGYKQNYGIDYKEFFALILKHDTIRLIIIFSA